MRVRLRTDSDLLLTIISQTLCLVPGSLVLDLDREPIEAEKATTAVCYSISNTQRGLAGVSFGNFLIKQVVEDLKAELPNVKTFVTLSPVPGFAAWLKGWRTASLPRRLFVR